MAGWRRVRLGKDAEAALFIERIERDLNLPVNQIAGARVLVTEPGRPEEVRYAYFSAELAGLAEGYGGEPDGPPNPASTLTLL